MWGEMSNLREKISCKIVLEYGPIFVIIVMWEYTHNTNSETGYI